MAGNPLVFHQVEASIDCLVEQTIKNPPQLDARDAKVVRAARAREGEVWSPQLLPYESWAARQDDAETEAGGTDGDLLVVGALGMGISDAEREALLTRAARHAAGSAAAPVARGRMEDGLRGAVEVRQDVDGYALSGFDLRRFAQAVGSDDGLVVTLPALVDGVPVVRIAAEAFARRLVQGVGVRLLVVPDTVERIAANAFLALSAERIHLGRGVRVLGEQPCDLAGVSPRLKRRAYSVDAGNDRFQARDGSLFSDGGATLLFLSSPYPARVALPEGVERVGAAAFAAGCEPPRIVSCGSGLAHVGSKAWDDAVWLCPKDAPAHRALVRRGVRIAGPRAVERDGCWYDFDDAGAYAVAGPPAPTSVSRRFASAAAVRAAALRGQGERAEPPSPGKAAAHAAQAAGGAGDEALALPPSVEGRPLARIGVRALPWAPASLVVPDTLRTVERDNACRGTKRLTLPEGLEVVGAHCFCSRILEGPVCVPASVRSVGEGCFEYAVCRLARTGTIVHVSADQLLTCFLDDPPDGVPFNFARYDALLLSGKSLPDRLGALLHRLSAPYRLDGEVRAALVARLRDQERAAQERVAREGDAGMVRALVEAGFIDERTFDRQIELLRACNRTDCVAYLMEWHRGQGGGKARPSRERFAL